MIKKVNFLKLKNENFLIIPIPFKDELLSSWIVRTAYAHKTHPHTFTNQYLNFRPHAFFETEADITITADMIELIAQKSYHKVDIKSLMLKTYSGYLQENIIDNPNRFISKLKFCPICFREDKIPYYRKTWRVSFYNICHKHRCYLYDSCLKCKSPLDLSTMYRNELPFSFCYECGSELKKGRKIPIVKRYDVALKYQNRIFEAIKNGYIQLGGKKVYSFLFFNVYSKFCKLIIGDKKHEFINTHVLYKQLISADGKKINHPICKRLDLKGQSAIFGLIMFIFDNYLHNLRRFILENELTYNQMITEIRYVPFWYEEIINEIVPRYVPHSITVTKEEVVNASQYLESIGKVANQTNLGKLLGCNFLSNDNSLKAILRHSVSTLS